MAAHSAARTSRPANCRTRRSSRSTAVLVRETARPEWLTPDYFRVGASSLLNDLLMQRSKQLTGAPAQTRTTSPGIRKRPWS